MSLNVRVVYDGVTQEVMVLFGLRSAPRAVYQVRIPIVMVISLQFYVVLSG